MSTKNSGIDGLSKSGKSILFMVALILALAVAWFVADRLARRPASLDIEECIAAASAKHGMPASLIRAIIWRESKFNPDIVGKANEIGLMQITEGAVSDWCRLNGKPTPSRKELFKPSVNIEIGTWYLAQAARHWDGYKSQEILTLSEYNAGYGNVSKGWKPKTPQDELKISDIKIASTRQYVETILAKKAEYEKKER